MAPKKTMAKKKLRKKWDSTSSDGIAEVEVDEAVEFLSGVASTAGVVGIVGRACLQANPFYLYDVFISQRKADQSSA